MVLKPMVIEKTAQETVQKTVPAGKPSFQLKTGKKLFVKPSLKQNLLKLQLVYIREPILVKLFYHGYFIDFIENENELLSILMVKSINRNSSPDHCPLFRPRYCIHRHHIYLLLIQQLSCNYEEPVFVRKDFMYKYVLNESKYALNMLSGVQSSAYHYCPGVISMRSRL
jgi:hypothetical protein